LFGSGWVWLAKDGDGKLSIEKESNAGNPIRKGLTPILGFDVWEHAYYLDYQNRRADHLKELWKIINWDVVGQRYELKAVKSGNIDTFDMEIEMLKQPTSLFLYFNRIA